MDGSRVGNHTTFQGLAARERAGWARFFSDFYLDVKNVFLFLLVPCSMVRFARYRFVSL